MTGLPVTGGLEYLRLSSDVRERLIVMECFNCNERIIVWMIHRIQAQVSYKMSGVSFPCSLEM